MSSKVDGDAHLALNTQALLLQGFRRRYLVDGIQQAEAQVTVQLDRTIHDDRFY